MELSPGTILLHCRPVEPIGESGMGGVWRATDTTLKSEAKILASLNHPNVATLFGLECVNTQMAAGTAAPQGSQASHERVLERAGENSKPKTHHGRLQAAREDGRDLG